MTRKQCSLCQRRFNTNAGLRKHQAHDHPDLSVRCRKCDLTFMGYSELRIHQWGAHRKETFGKRRYKRAAANGAGNEITVREMKLIPVEAPAAREMTVSQFIATLEKQREHLTNVIDLAKGYTHVGTSE